MNQGIVVIPKTWRSELLSAILFVLFCPVAYFITIYLPFTVVTGPLFDIGSTRITLSLPLASFLPAGALLRGVYRIYNVRYFLDSKGIEARQGVLSLRQRVIRIRFEDIRALEVGQSLVERLLDIGQLEASTAASNDSEIIMMGIASPYNFKRVIQLERDKRQSVMRRDRGGDGSSGGRSAFS
jgi:membrane protein YdbS with pleckstrin-like domain